MIFVKGYGQMCNNILQFAHAYAWGRENNVPVVSMRFAYKYRYFNICNTKYHSWPVYLFAKTMIKTKWMECYVVDDAKDITPALLDGLKEHRIVGLDGWYFRFPELFLKYKEEIKELFAFKPKEKKQVDKLLKECSASDSIKLAMHIRRGDYSRWLGGKYFFDDATYIDYIRQFMQLFPNKKIDVFICTNDKNLKVEEYRSALGIDSIFNPKGGEAEDLYLMSKCDYVMGVRSTFSLMAAFYNDLPIYWLMDKNETITLEGFKSFEDLFMEA